MRVLALECDLLCETLSIRDVSYRRVFVGDSLLEPSTELDSAFSLVPTSRLELFGGSAISGGVGLLFLSTFGDSESSIDGIRWCFGSVG